MRAFLWNVIAKVPQVVRFALFYLWQLILSNLRVAHDIMTPTHYMRPGVIAILLDAETDIEITLLANLITLTPGTLSLDLSADRRVLYVHTMYIDNDDVEEARRQIKEGLERRVLQVLR
jgi:multicomponent Na+:H+ antiporter subunit E